MKFCSTSAVTRGWRRSIVLALACFGVIWVVGPTSGGASEPRDDVGSRDTFGTPPRWNGSGHQIVCRIAWTHLTESAQQRVAELTALEARYPDFPASCVWADELRAEIRSGVPSVQHLSRYTPSHYVNTPPGQPGVDPDTCRRERSDGVEVLCVVDAIREMTAILNESDSSSDSTRRVEALKFLAHFVADIHQPLHAGYGSDRGGNSFRVSIMGLSDRNLHGVWDAFFLEHGGRPWRALADELAARVTPIDVRLWSSLDPLDWADESYQLVENEVYRGLDPDGAYVGQDYYDRNIATVERQLMKAGVRLALLLNHLLDPNH